MKLIDRALDFDGRTAIRDENGDHDYRSLVAAADVVAARLGHVRGERVAYHVRPSFAHVATQWGIWRAGGSAVPLALVHPAPEIAHVLANARVAAVVGDRASTTLLREACDLAGNASLAPAAIEDLLGTRPSREPSDPARVFDPGPVEQAALLLYTSGTTSRPKGVMLTAASLEAQITALVDAWKWTERDHILSFLPLHHMHGLVNVVLCALWSGATCEFVAPFDAVTVWRRIVSGDVTIVMGVPTVYHHLARAWEAADEPIRRSWREGCRHVRLMISGSAALPAPMLERWRAITGHTLLERYGMTEIGVALSNPLDGERFPGHVGWPLEGGEVRLVGDDGHVVAPGEPGEIETRGGRVFSGYWDDPAATEKAFRDGWFRTGDLAILEPEGYRILGRVSTDIIKSGGYKISALEIEEALLGHPHVRECAVFATPDETWGERVGAAIVWEDASTRDAEGLAAWLRTRVAPYKVPKTFRFVEALPRNALGKVVKSELRKRAD